MVAVGRVGGGAGALPCVQCFLWVGTRSASLPDPRWAQACGWDGDVTCGAVPGCRRGPPTPLLSPPPCRHPEIVLSSLPPRERCHGQSRVLGGLHPSTRETGHQRGTSNPARAVVVLFGVLWAAFWHRPAAGLQEDGLCRVSAAALGVFWGFKQRREFGCGVMSSCSVTTVGGWEVKARGSSYQNPHSLFDSWCESSLPAPLGTRAAVTAAAGAEPIFAVFLAPSPSHPALFHLLLPDAPCKRPQARGLRAPDEPCSLGHRPGS